MVIRRGDQRRRRVVRDEVAQSTEASETVAPKQSAKSNRSSAKSGSADSRAYTFGANRRSQRKTTDLFPKRFLSFALVVLVLLACIGLLNLGAANIAEYPELVGVSGVDAFAITGGGTLSSWFSSFLLIITGLASLQIYALRQHRCDDYRGTYRIWIWMSALFILASVNCVVDLGQVSTNVAESIMQRPLGEAIWPLITIKLLALSMLVARGLFEIRESRGATVMVVLVWIAYSAAIVMQIPAVRDSVVLNSADTCHGNLLLFGNCLLFLSHLTYARFVYLHAHGLITLPERKAATVKKAKKKVKAKTKVKSKTQSGTSPSVKKRKVKKKRTVVADQDPSKSRTPQPVPEKQPARPPVPKPSQNVAGTDRGPVPKPSNEKASQTGGTHANVDGPENTGRLSKSERRRQRKLEKRQQRRAA